MTRGLIVFFIGALLIFWMIGGVGLVIHLCNDFSWMDSAKGLGATIFFLLIMRWLFKKAEKLYNLEESII
ncbi:MAG: hypothetical protein ABIJ81_03145 [Patescibacteria group bacterium]